MFDYQNSICFMRDGFVPFKNANLSIASSPVLYGLGIYTVVPANWNKKHQKLYVFRLQDHYKRLLGSAKIMDFEHFLETWTYAKFEATILELLCRNNIGEDVLIRISLFVDELLAGTKMRGLKVSLSAFVYPLGELLPLSGIDVCVSSWQRTPDNAIPARAKVNGSYVNACLIKNEALLNGYNEAISLDQQGHVAEGSVANIFMVASGVLITPDSSTDILEGITRDSIFQIAQANGIECQQRTIDRSELYVFDEMFMCGSSARITPVLSVDRRPVGNGRPGKITQFLMTTYTAIQHGNTPNFSNWRLPTPLLKV